MASHWEVSFNDVGDFEAAHIVDETHTSLDGSFWLYTPISPPNPDFGNIDQVTFITNLAPLGVFWMSKVAPTKLEMKVISFWELLRPKSA
jgi:hypothetical protein